MPAEGNVDRAGFPFGADGRPFFCAIRMPTNAERVVVVGAGVIGLSVAWRLARAGARITVVERDRPGRGASRVAAGMLAPISEAGFHDEEATRFARASLARYPSFLTELESDADMRVALDTRGTLVVARDADDAAYIRRAYEYRRSIGLPVEWLSGSAAREAEPLLSPRVSAAMSVPDDCQVDTRAFLVALERACTNKGVEIRAECEVRRVDVSDNVARGVACADETVAADTVVVAAGAWSGSLPGVPGDAAPPVRPVKGQLLRLKKTSEFPLAYVIRSPRAYLLPKDDGTVIVGATQEEVGFDVTPTAGGIKDILEHAWEIVPAIYDLPLDGVEVGLRPGSRDNRPVIGATRVRGLVMATGHFRHGILLAPATADAVCEGVTTGTFPSSVAAFAPSRFGASEARHAH
jgi:glycine oxidase